MGALTVGVDTLAVGVDNQAVGVDTLAVGVGTLAVEVGSLEHMPVAGHLWVLTSSLVKNCKQHSLKQYNSLQFKRSMLQLQPVATFNA